MKIALIGGGIIGTCSALRLAQDGHHVTVFDANGSVAEGASFANAGVIAPGYVTPWASPGMPGKVIKQMFQADAAVKFTLQRDPAQWRWLRHWLAACKPSAYQHNRTAMQQLAQHSLQVMKHWRDTYAFDYEQRTGYLQLLRTERDVQLAQPALAMLKELQHPHQLVDDAQCRKLEPYLSPHTRVQTAIHLPQDEIGNCRHFAQQARDAAGAMGVAYRLRERVLAINPQQSGVVLKVADDTERFDRVVVCAGVDSTALLKPIGIKLPLLPLWGYSLSAPIKDASASPFQAEVSQIAGMMDEHYKVSLTRLGNRLRVAGIAELGATPGEVNAAAVNTLYKVLQDWFIACVDLKHAQTWMGARPMLPDGPPVIGATQVPNVWLNTGHGSSGWALACGSADVLADLLQERNTALNAAAYSPARYTKAGAN